MKFLLYLCLFLVLNNFALRVKANLLKLSNFLTLFHKNSSNAKAVLGQNLTFQEIDPFEYFSKANSLKGLEVASYELLINNEKFDNLTKYPIKHDLDYEMTCEVKQSFILKLDRLEIGIISSR